MTWPEAMLAAFLAVLGRSRWWIVALAAFLVRGGIVALLPPILVLPTPAELATLISPNLTGTGINSLGPAFLALVLGLAAATGALLIAGSLAGAWLEAGLLADVSADEELERLGKPPLRRSVATAAAVRLAAHVPTLVALVAGIVAVSEAAYAELLAPTGTGSLLVRVLARVPAAAILVLGTWALGEAWGGAAARRLALGWPWLRAMGRGLLDVLRPSGLATLGLTSIVGALPLVGLWLASGRAFDRLWPFVVDATDPQGVAIGLGFLVGSWAMGLWLLAIALAWRSAAWTAQVLRGR